MSQPTDPQHDVAKVMRVIVCGSRNFANRAWLYSRLDRLPRPVVIVHGAATGADTLAGEWALGAEGATAEAHPAEWDKFSHAAGPIRNGLMAKLGADLCIAFPTGTSKGTWDMVRQARDAGIPVEVNPEVKCD